MGWLIALGILVLLAILPLGASARYDHQGFSLKIIAGPVRIGILPAKKKDPNKPKKEKKKPEEKKKAAPAGEKTTEKGGSFRDFIPLVKVGLEFLNHFRKKIRINRLYMKLILAGDDPCDLAVNYGRCWEAIGNLMPQLDRFFVIKKRNVEAECDFEASNTVIFARADATITLGRLLFLVCKYGVRALKIYLNIQKSRKGGAPK